MTRVGDCRDVRGPFTLSLDCDGSEVANCNSVVVDRYTASFEMTDSCCVWKLVLCWIGLLGRFAWSKLICYFNAEFRWAFLRLLFLGGGAGHRELTRLWMLSSRSAWFGRSLLPGKPSNSPSSSFAHSWSSRFAKLEEVM
jgi:hypothetical protein